MARREGNIDDERRSYSAIFLLAVGLLLVGAVWAVWDDNIARRPWKYYQAEFFRRERDQVRQELSNAADKVEKNPEYQTVSADLAAARERLRSGETGKRVAQLEADLHRLTVKYGEADLKLRIQKSRLEAAWYEYDHALLAEQPTADARQRAEALDHDKAAIQQSFEDAKAQREQIEKELAEVRSEVKRLEDKQRTFTTDRERLQQKLDGLTLAAGPFRFPPIPKIRQMVIEEFDRNNFDKPLARVDRCTSCHAGIDKPGFEDTADHPVPNPYKTHPQRQEILGHHPLDKFGCTPCHQGQGAAVNSPEQAHGEVKYWEQPLLRGEKVQASCIKCHANVDALGKTDRIQIGQKLFEELGCHGCHLVEGYEDLPKVGPYLRLAQAKLEPAWLVRWITNPHEVRPNTRMPNFMFKPEQAESIAAYLLNATKDDSATWLATRPTPTGIDANDPALVARGQELVNSIGCRGCHGFAEGEAPALLGTDKHIAPNLSHVAEKTDPRWLYYWIKGPREYSPMARMPSLRLSDDEARAIVSYLLTLGERHPNPDLAAKLSNPQRIADGKALVRKYGCFGCHDVTGMENESRIGVELTTFGSKPIEELFFGDHTDIPETWDAWTYNKLKTPRTYATERIEQLMPQFDLADDDIRALRVFLTSRIDEKVPLRFRADRDTRGQREVAGQRLVNRYNCVGCHVIEHKGGAIRALAPYKDSPTLAPPILNGEGSKVQSDWLFNFLKHPVPLRPWLKLRMPTFGLSDQETTTLVQYFAATDNVQVPFVHIEEAQIPAEHLVAAKQLMSTDYFSCFSCHQQGDRRPEGPPEGWAPDLGMARQRLQPEWVIRWLHDPQVVQPGTKMPSFYEKGADGTAAGGPEDVLNGDNERQIRALRDYLMVLNDADRLLAQARHDGQLAAADGAAAEHGQDHAGTHTGE